MSKFLEGAGLFVLALLGCCLVLGVLFGFIWIWTLGLIYCTKIALWVGIIYGIGSIAILPALAITLSIMEEK